MVPLNHLRLYASSLIALFLLNGCGLSPFVKPEEQAVVDEHVFSGFPFKPRVGVHAVSTKMERRLVMIEQKEEGDKRMLKICAESPAEATQALNSITQLAAKLDKVNIDLTGNFNSELSTAVNAVFKRTQGLQFYRDAAYQLCQAYLNGLFGQKDEVENEVFRVRLGALEDKAVRLIEKELELEKERFSYLQEKEKKEEKKPKYPELRLHINPCPPTQSCSNVILAGPCPQPKNCSNAVILRVEDKSEKRPQPPATGDQAEENPPG